MVPIEIVVEPVMNVTVAVFAVIVMAFAAVHAAPETLPVMVIDDEPSVSVREPPLEFLNDPHEHVWLPVFSVPVVKLMRPVDDVEKASWNVQPPPVPMNVHDGIVWPAVFIVCPVDVAVNDHVPV